MLSLGWHRETVAHDVRVHRETDLGCTRITQERPLAEVAFCPGETLLRDGTPRGTSRAAGRPCRTYEGFLT